MIGWRKKNKKALEQFKALAQSTRRYDRHQPLASHATADNLLYAANPVYIEVTQGGASPIRGFAAVIWLGILLGCWWGSFVALENAFGPLPPEMAGIWRIIDFIMGLVLLAGSSLPFFLLFFSFFAPTDAIVRFDRKRQVVCKWSEQGLIEIPWANLTPVVQGMVSSPMQASKTYRGLFVEYADNGEPRCTHSVPHLMMVGLPSGDEEGALLFLEYVRRYMEDGWQAVPRPTRWLRHRPRWRAMFNFVGIVDDWIREERAPTGLGKPWGLAIFFGGASLALFPLQVTNWLALQVAPRPKWPRALQALHANELAEIGYLPNGRRASADASDGLHAPGDDEPSGWLDRLAALVAIPMAFLSPLMFWVAGFGYLSFFHPGLYEAAFWSCVLGLAATAIALLSLRYVIASVRA